MSVPAWYQNAVDDLGLVEGRGSMDNPAVVAMFKNTGYQSSHDATPWCGAAMATWMAKAGIKYDKANAASAASWAKFGIAVKPDENMPIGTVMVKHRDGGNHVCLFAGWADANFTIAKIIGGNQSKTGEDGAVTMSKEAVNRFYAFRWPKEAPLPVPNQKLRKSGVIQGAAVAVGGGGLSLATEAPRITQALQDADSASSTGTWLGIIAGVVIIAAAGYAIWSRISAAKAEYKTAA